MSSSLGRVLVTSAGVPQPPPACPPPNRPLPLLARSCAAGVPVANQKLLFKGQLKDEQTLQVGAGSGRQALDTHCLVAPPTGLSSPNCRPHRYSPLPPLVLPNCCYWRGCCRSLG